MPSQSGQILLQSWNLAFMLLSLTWPFKKSRSFISVPRASSHFGGTAPPIDQGQLEFFSLSFKVLTSPISACVPSCLPWWMPDKLPDLEMTLSVKMQYIQPITDHHFPQLGSLGQLVYYLTHCRKSHRGMAKISLKLMPIIVLHFPLSSSPSLFVQ